MRAWWLLPLLAAVASAQEREGVEGEGKDAVAPLLKEAAHPDAKVRARALRALGRATDDRAAVAARAALSDADEGVRVEAAVALVKLAAPEAKAVDVLAKALQSPEWYTRFEACVALGALGKDALAATPALLVAASDEKLDIGREAVIALLRVAPKDPQVLDGLVRLLQSERDVDRVCILVALDSAGQIALAREWLATELFANRYRMRKRVLGLLAKCGDPGIATIVEALGNPDPDLRLDALWRLSGAKGAGREVFVAALADEAAPVRRAAISVLVTRSAGEAAPAIAALLDDPEVRNAAVEALLTLKTPVPTAGAKLLRFTLDEDPNFAKDAVDALRATGFGGLAGQLEWKFTSEPQEGSSPWSVRIRLRGGNDDRAESLDRIVTEIDDARNIGLVAALKETLAKEQDELLIDALSREDPLVRRAAAKLLGHLARDPERAIRALHRAQLDKSAEVRAAATEAIRRLRP